MNIKFTYQEGCTICSIVKQRETETEKTLETELIHSRKIELIIEFKEREKE